MEMREQRYVLAIDQFRSIKKAAEYLHIAPPTLSVFLSNLEAIVGMQLFDRLGKTFVPTEAGKLYIENAKELIRIRDRYETQMNELKKETKGLIRFGIHPRRTLFLLAETMAKYTPLHPEVQIATFEGMSDEMFRLLLDGNLDFIINNRFHPDPSLTYIPFYQDRLVAVLSADHPAIPSAFSRPGETLQSLDLSVLNDSRFIFPYPAQSVRIFADKAIAYAGARPGQTFLVENLESGNQMAAEGLGVAFNFESYAKHFSYPKPFCCFYVGDPTETIDYFIIYRKDHYMPKYVQEFVAVLKEELVGV